MRRFHCSKGSELCHQSDSRIGAAAAKTQNCSFVYLSHGQAAPKKDGIPSAHGPPKGVQENVKIHQGFRKACKQAHKHPL